MNSLKLSLSLKPRAECLTDHKTETDSRSDLSLSRMKLLRSNSLCRSGISRIFTETLTTSSSTSSSSDSLSRRISRSGDPRASIVAVLDQWLDEGKNIKQSELQMFVKQLRKFRRFTQALQVSEWMNDQRNHDQSPGDIAVRLDLISKVHGLEQAEKYFNSIPETLRGLQVYGALLNCYAHKKSLEKAEAIMQKMRDLGFAKCSLPYNVMLGLYSQLGEHEKLDILMQEMEEMGINFDRFTFNIRMNAYAATSNIEGMEKLLLKMEADPHIMMDWNAYVVAANGYLKAGLIAKALTMLKKSEQLIDGKTKRFAYEIILTLYTATGNKDEVYRIWNLYKNMGKVYNSGYICMISSLVKLDDIDGAERIFEEWESGYAVFDIRVPNVLISAYSKNGLLEKAEACVNRLIESGNEPDAFTWDRMATGYHVDGQIAKAVEAMKKVISLRQPGWKPNQFTLAACIEHVKGQGDIAVAGKLLSLLKERGHFSSGVCDNITK